MCLPNERYMRAVVEDIKAEFRSPTRKARLDSVQKIWKAFLNVPLWPAAGLIRETIAKGEVEGRPFDVSSLAASLAMPRTTIHRELQKLEKSGAIKRVKSGRRIQLYLTDQGWRQIKSAWAMLDPVVDDLIKPGRTSERR